MLGGTLLLMIGVVMLGTRAARVRHGTAKLVILVHVRYKPIGAQEADA
jgi:hypothetical protein